MAAVDGAVTRPAAPALTAHCLRPRQVATRGAAAALRAAGSSADRGRTRREKRGATWKVTGRPLGQSKHHHSLLAETGATETWKSRARQAGCLEKERTVVSKGGLEADR